MSSEAQSKLVGTRILLFLIFVLLWQWLMGLTIMADGANLRSFESSGVALVDLILISSPWAALVVGATSFAGRLRLNLYLALVIAFLVLGLYMSWLQTRAG